MFWSTHQEPIDLESCLTDLLLLVFSEWGVCLVVCSVCSGFEYRHVAVYLNIFRRHSDLHQTSWKYNITKDMSYLTTAGGGYIRLLPCFLAIKRAELEKENKICYNCLFWLPWEFCFKRYLQVKRRSILLSTQECSLWTLSKATAE